MLKKKMKKVVAKKGAYKFNRDGVTNSLLQKWLSCRVAARHSLDGIRHDLYKPKTQLGSFFHALLEKWYTLKQEGAKCFDRQVFDAFAASERDKIIESGGDLQKFEALLASAYGLFMEYVPFHKKSDAKKDWGGLEEVFDVKWNGYRLRGRIDGWYKDITGKLCLFETKTKSRISEDTIKTSLLFDSQNLFYITAMEVITGERINEVCYNVVRSPSLRQKQTETQEDYYVRIREDIAKRPEHYFKRFPVQYTQRQKKVYQQDLMLKLHEFDEWCAGNRPTYRSECSCSRGWECTYLNLCATGCMESYNMNGILFGELQD